MLKKSMIALATLTLCASLYAPPAGAAHCGVTLFQRPVGSPPAVGTTCHLRANSRDHFIHVSVTPFATAVVYDDVTGVAVFSGTAGVWGIERTIPGLFGAYYAIGISSVFAVVEISND